MAQRHPLLEPGGLMTKHRLPAALLDQGVTMREPVLGADLWRVTMATLGSRGRTLSRRALGGLGLLAGCAGSGNPPPRRPASRQRP